MLSAFPGFWAALRLDWGIPGGKSVKLFPFENTQIAAPHILFNGRSRVRRSYSTLPGPGMRGFSQI